MSVSYSKMPQASNFSEENGRLGTNRGSPVTIIGLRLRLDFLRHIKIDGKSDMLLELFGGNMMMMIRLDEVFIITIVLIKIIKAIGFVFGGSKLCLVVVMKLLHLESLNDELVAFHLPFVGGRSLWSWNIGLTKIIVAICGKTFFVD